VARFSGCLAGKKTCLARFTHERIELATRSPYSSFKQDRVGRDLQLFGITASYPAKGLHEGRDVRSDRFYGRHDLRIRKRRLSGGGSL